MHVMFAEVPEAKVKFWAKSSNSTVQVDKETVVVIPVKSEENLGEIHEFEVPDGGLQAWLTLTGS